VFGFDERPSVLMSCDAHVIVVTDEKRKFGRGCRGCEVSSKVKEESKTEERQQLVHGNQEAIRSQERLNKVRNKLFSYCK